jgi:hypothetical protein
MDPTAELPAPYAPGSEAGVSAETGDIPADLLPVPEGIHCPDCGYDLRGLTGARCPECGLDLEIVRTQTPQIPWARRREIGWFRAYWQTVWLVGRHPRRLYTEMVRPVSYRDSQSFRWLTFLHAFGSVLISAIIVLARLGEWQEWDSLLTALGLVLGAGVLFAVLPGAGSYALESRRLPAEQRNRGIALSYYAWASLAAMPFFVLLVVVASVTGLIWDTDHNSVAFYVAGVCAAFAALFPLLIFVDAEARLACLCRRVLREHGRAWLRIICINGVALGALVVAAVVPLSVFYFLIIWYSLH